MSVPTIKLNDGSEVPVIAIGTGTALFGRDCANAIQLAIECGVTHLDGAQAYGNEASLGAGIKAAGKPRSDLYVVTKLKPGTKAADVKSSLVDSLNKLGLDFVDLFLIHTPSRDGTVQEIWQAMEAVHAEGLAKSIGVSNFTVDDLKAILPRAKVIPSVNQLEIHPYVWKAVEPIVKYGRENGGITCSSFGGLSPLIRAPRRTRRPVTPAQVLFKWILQKGAFVVTTSSKEARIKEYLEVSHVPDLTAEEIQAIDNAGAKQHKRFFGKQIFGDS
ncbi:Aldo-ket-red domain-containing protein [Mycena sanguinolenta]|uniref:Aldo-ket-red domain-containing protein n=1 Tax=Mycena sanguinolenta TaxID=230812 RepID=A0A8H6YLZ1_9AGAR|nr:Aldo-ket-red domain-containing protein [Mycena sanguinolenta]